MEAEAFPMRFTRGVRAYWRRRKYHRLESSGRGGAATPTRQLGGGWRRRMRVRVRAFMTAPRRVLARARDAYVGAMLALARKASPAAAVHALPPGSKRAPRRKQQQQLLPAPRTGPTEFEQRLILEIYKSIVASKELTTMLHSSTAHRQTLPAVGVGHGHHQQAVHLLDM